MRFGWRETIQRQRKTKQRKNQVNEPFFVTSKSSLQKLIQNATFHGRICSKTLEITKIVKKGHVSVLKLKCSCAGKKLHTYMWSSSPFIQNGKYLVNERINHAFICSGMLPSHYARFMAGANMGIISAKARDAFFKSYKRHIAEEYEESTDQALWEEIGSYEDLSGIDIITDARHGWRKNAKDTGVVAIGNNMHKVLMCVTVTKLEDHVTQRHEQIGTAKIYQALETKDVTVRVHTHDRNMAINKFVRNQPPTVNQNDTWHGVKSVKKSMSEVASGPRYLEGKKWSEELHDKVESVATHFHWAMRNCNGDSAKLRLMLDNVVDHYKNIHDKCSESSRCRADPKYEPKTGSSETPKQNFYFEELSETRPFIKVRTTLIWPGILFS